MNNLDHLDYDPLLVSITHNHNEVKEKTMKLQRELDNVQKLIKSLVDEEQALITSINTSKDEEAELLKRYEATRTTVLTKWSQLSQINQIDCFWNVLPNEVLAIIFCYLDYKEVLHSVSLVNKKWNEIVFSNNQLWFAWLSNNRWIWGSSKCILDSNDSNNNNKLWIAVNNNNNTIINNDKPSINNEVSPSDFMASFLSGNNISNPANNNNNNNKYRKDYKNLFTEAAKSERKWKKGEAVYGSFKSGHPSLSCISLDHRYMITARRSFKIWDIHFSEAPRCVKILDPHLAHNTKCMQVNGDLLIAGGKYGLKVLNIETSQSHLICEDECYALHFDNNTLVHGSFNQIVVRDMHTLKPVHTFIGHGNMVKGICRNDDTIVTASWLQTKIWDLRTKVCQKIMHSGVKRNCCVADDNIVVSSNGRVVHVWDLRVHKESLLLNRNVSALYLEGQKLVIARKDRCIDIMNAKLDPTPYVVLGPIMTEESVENSTRITSIKTHYRKMIAGTSKGTVHVWEF